MLDIFYHTFMNISSPSKDISVPSPIEHMETIYAKQIAYFQALQETKGAIENSVETINGKEYAATFINLSTLGIEDLYGGIVSRYNPETGEYYTTYSSKDLKTMQEYQRAQSTALSSVNMNMNDSYSVAIYRGLEIYMEQLKKAEQLQQETHEKIISHIG